MLKQFLRHRSRTCFDRDLQVSLRVQLCTDGYRDIGPSLEYVHNRMETDHPVPTWRHMITARSPLVMKIELRNKKILHRVSAPGLSAGYR